MKFGRLERAELLGEDVGAGVTALATGRRPCGAPVQLRRARPGADAADQKLSVAAAGEDSALYGLMNDFFLETFSLPRVWRRVVRTGSRWP